jgi:hypothetical protein
MRPVLAAIAVLAVLPSTAAARSTPDPVEVASACTTTPIRATFSDREWESLREIAACALEAARKARDVPTRESLALKSAANQGLRLAIGLDGGPTQANRDRVVRRVLDRWPCRGSERVRVLVADSTKTGGARTPLEITRFVLRAAAQRSSVPLTGRATKLAVVALPGRVFTARKTGAVSVIVAGATCRPVD